MNKLAASFLSAGFLLGTTVGTCSAQTERAVPPNSTKWENCLAQSPDWYGDKEAIRIADNVLLYQHDTGGWPKNLEMTKLLSEPEKLDLLKQKKESKESTIDNGATYTQIAYLAKVYTPTRQARFKESLMKGVDYLLKAQYENGGWPQFYPNLSGYYKHITFNDGAMIGVMMVLRDIAEKKAGYEFVDETRRRRAQAAVRKGIDCILKTQVVVDGKRTAWCAQHDEITLAPANARNYELKSLSGGESVDIVRFLMRVDHPDGQVIGAIHSAVAWFQKSTIAGIRVVEVPNPTQPRGFDRLVRQDPKGEPLWARFYEIGSNRPLFVGRDGIARYNLAEIEAERRNNYRWYVTTPSVLLNQDYQAWLKKWVK